jgi:hypothetical protein
MQKNLTIPKKARTTLRSSASQESADSNRSRPVEEFGGGLLVEAGFDGGTEPLVDGPFLQAAGF